MDEKQIENLASVALGIVALVVFLALIRLVISHWSYFLLVIAVSAAGFYIYKQMQKYGKS